MSINLHRACLNLRHPESIFPRDVSQKIFPLVNQKIRRAIKFVSVHRARGSFCWYLQPLFLIHLSVMSIRIKSGQLVWPRVFDFSAECKQHACHNRAINFGKDNLLKIMLFLRQLSNCPSSTNCPGFSRSRVVAWRSFRSIHHVYQYARFASLIFLVTEFPKYPMAFDPSYVVIDYVWKCRKRTAYHGQTRI